MVTNYDSDVLLPVDTYVKAQEMCKGEYDLVYPYGQGMWQKQIFADDNLVSDFLSNDCKFDILERQSKDYDAQSGHVQFFKLNLTLKVEWKMKTLNHGDLRMQKDCTDLIL